jgi:hypothetical protein
MHFNSNPPIHAWVFPVASFLQISPPELCIHLSWPPYVLYVLTILVFLIWSHE